MKRAQGRIRWDLSPSSDIVNQRIVVKVFDEEVLNSVVSPSVNEVPLTLDENTQALVEITVTDGTFSKSASTVVSVGDLSEPQAVSNINFQIDAVIDE